MRRTLIILVAFTALAWMAWEFFAFQVFVWDGVFQLTVHLESGGPPLKTVGCVLAGREEAEHVMAHMPRPDVEFTGQPLTVSVPCGGRFTQSGRELYRYQYPHLVVVADFQDGTRVCKRVDIPDGCGSREVRVSLP